MCIKVGTRPSQLALVQVEEFKKLLSHVSIEPVAIEAEGDKDKTTPLTGGVSDDFFTGSIEKALLDGEIDVALHSAKDLEDDLPEELEIAAITKSLNPYDAIVSRDNLALDELPEGSTIGTSSVNRQEAIKRYRRDLVTKDIRGNVDDRIKQLDRGDFDVIIVAYAALIRLGLSDRASQVLPLSIIEPHPLQGRLAIQVRKDRPDLRKLFKEIDER